MEKHIKEPEKFKDKSCKPKMATWNDNLSDVGKSDNFSFRSKSSSSQMASSGKSFLEKPERVIHNHAFESNGSTKVNSEPSQNKNQSVSLHIESGRCNFPIPHEPAPEKFDQLSSRISLIKKYLEDIASYICSNENNKHLTPKILNCLLKGGVQQLTNWREI